MSPFEIGLIGLGVMLLLMFFRVPIAFSFIIVGFAGYIYLRGFNSGLPLLGIMPWRWVTDYVLMAVPLFILMGELLGQGGAIGEVFDAANKWVGRIPGSMAIATELSCTGFAACTGSSVASAAAMGSISIPEMRRLNYDLRLASGCVAAGGTLGILIPPSIPFIVYGVITEQSVGALFLAGILPGILISLLYILLIFFRVKRNPKLAPAPPASYSWRERINAFRGVWGVPLVFIIIIGGLYGGIFTPTEAAAVSTAVAIIFLLLRRRITRQVLSSTLMNTVRFSGMLFSILIGAMVFQSFMAISGVPQGLALWISALPLPRVGLMAALILLYIPLGCVMETMSMLILCVPIMFPIVTALGFDPIWFGVISVIAMEIGLLTPPVGLNAYVIHGVVPDIPLEDIFRGIAPFIAMNVLALILVFIFPQIALFIPSLMM